MSPASHLHLAPTGEAAGQLADLISNCPTWQSSFMSVTSEEPSARAVALGTLAPGAFVRDPAHMKGSVIQASALSVDQAAAVHAHRRCAAIALVRWDRLLVLGLLVMLGGLIVPPTPLAGASSTAEATVHEVRALRVHLVLLAGRTLSAGASTSGYVVIDNTAKTSIAVTQACGGKPDVAVVLSSPKVRQAAAFALVKCPDVELTPGLHRYPIDIRASYQGCIGPGGSGGGFPPCFPAPENGPPPLPVGRYQAVMATDSSIPTAKPLPVTVIYPRANPIAYRAAPLATRLTVPTLRSLEESAADEARVNGDASVHRGYIILTTPRASGGSRHRER